MLKLKIDDLNFILKKTRLSLKSLLNLIEEERDYNLVLDSISSTLTEDEKLQLCNLSPILKVKLSIYNCAKNTDFDIEEKSYMTDILSNHYNFVYKGRVLGRGTKKEVRYLLGIIKQNKVDNQTIKQISNIFAQKPHKSLASHFPTWLEIINRSKDILSVNTYK